MTKSLLYSKKLLLVLLQALFLLLSILPRCNGHDAFTPKSQVATGSAIVKSLPPVLWHIPLVIASSEATIFASKHLLAKINATAIISPDTEELLEENLGLKSRDIQETINNAPATIVICILNILTFVMVVLIKDLFPMAEPVIRNHFYFSDHDPMVRRKHPHSFLLSGFMHHDIFHLGSNMWAMLIFGRTVEKLASLNRRLYVYFYIIAIHISKYLNVSIFHRFTAARATVDTIEQLKRVSAGASGAISALQVYFCLMHPTASIKMGPIWFPAPVACFFWSFREWTQMRYDKNSRVGHGAHLGGYLVGILFFLVHDIILEKDSFWREYRILNIQSALSFSEEAKMKREELMQEIVEEHNEKVDQMVNEYRDKRWAQWWALSEDQTNATLAFALEVALKFKKVRQGFPLALASTTRVKKKKKKKSNKKDKATKTAKGKKTKKTKGTPTTSSRRHNRSSEEN